MRRISSRISASALDSSMIALSVISSVRYFPSSPVTFSTSLTRSTRPGCANCLVDRLTLTRSSRADA